MATKDVDPGMLVIELAEVLKKENMVNPPVWAAYVKTGSQAIRPPENPDWWYIRAAAILRQVYMRGNVGVGSLRDWFGGRKKRGSAPEAHQQAGGKVIRLCMQQLEAAGLIVKDKAGRKITPKGQALLDKTASASVKPKMAAAEAAKHEMLKAHAEASAEAKPKVKKADVSADAAAPAAEAKPAEKPKAKKAKKAEAPVEGEAVPAAEKPKKAKAPDAGEKPASKRAPKAKAAEEAA